MNYPRLSKTWFIDFDGTIVMHRGKGANWQRDILLPNVREFFDRIGENDIVVITTARKSEEVQGIVEFMKENALSYHYILSDLPTGARVVVNDSKPSGYQTAYAINVERDAGMDIEKIDRIIRMETDHGTHL